MINVVTDIDCYRHKVVRFDEEDPRIVWTACGIRVVLSGRRCLNGGTIRKCPEEP